MNPITVNYPQQLEQPNIGQSSFDSFRDYLTFLKSQPGGGFFSTPRPDAIADSHQLADRLQTQFDTLLIIGMGGSSLGVNGIYRAFQGQIQKNSYFADNLDPSFLYTLFSEIKNKIPTTLVYLVSKSGNTLETWYIFSTLVKFLNDEKISFDLKKQVVVCTENTINPLTTFANQNQIEQLYIPENVGGRYSLFTPVGLFPLAFYSKKIFDGFVTGATNCINFYLHDENHLKDLYYLSRFIFQTSDSKINQLVLFTYSHLLAQFHGWWMQLWAESLGKVGKGTTPLCAVGSSDQHSLLQLFMDGPKNKLFFMTGINQSKEVFCDSQILQKGLPSLNLFSINRIYESQFQGTKKALQDSHRPVIDCHLKDDSPESVSFYLMYWMLLTATHSYHLQVNPFDQPAVEVGKINTLKIISEGNLHHE